MNTTQHNTTEQRKKVQTQRERKLNLKKKDRWRRHMTMWN